MPPSPPLVSPQWLVAHLRDPGLRIVDARWSLRCLNGREITGDNPAAYLAGHIPGAVYVGMHTELSDPDHPVPDMLAPPQRFARVMARLGIGDDTHVVTCDDMGVPLAAARLWWALSFYGHDRVRVLDGGLRQWRALGYPISSGVPVVEPACFTPRARQGWLASREDVIAALGNPAVRIIDCLTAEHYSGEEGASRSGHIPGAGNVPYPANIDPALAAVTMPELEGRLASRAAFTLASPAILAELYEQAGVTPDLEVITYCGRGYAGACGLLALKCLGQEAVRLYDGSWLEWCDDPSLPVETNSPRR